MHVAALQQFAQHVAHLLADAEQADRAAFGGFLVRARIWLDSVRARSSTSNTSRLSPGLMSLVSASSTPHSRPGVDFGHVVLEAPQRA